jgi:hypothetical protein
MTARGRVVHITLLHVPDCPLVDGVRATVRNALTTTGIEAIVEEVKGPYASPTLLVDGGDVTGALSHDTTSCRLDLPTEAQVLTALQGARG